MIKTISLGLLLLLVVGCGQKQPDDLSAAQMVSIKTGVKAVTDSIISRWAALDADGALQYFTDSPHWAWFGPSGARIDYQAFGKLWKQIDDSSASLRLITTREQFTVLARDVVICAWEGKDETTMKSGDKLIYDPHAITFVFRKIDDHWRVTYTHESGIPVWQRIEHK